MIPRLAIAVRAYTSNGSHGHNNTGAGRSSSILASLLRLRQQYQRAGGHATNRTPTANTRTATARGGAEVGTSSSASSSPSPTLTSSSSASLVCRDALRLLNTETRAMDSLSDVPKSSPQYAAEVGKLLAVAATFGGSSTASRVKEALDWVSTHPQYLTTTRQVMSITMPLLNLSDGAEAGVPFVYEVLMPLLQASLSAVVAGAIDTSEDAHRTSLVAVVSVFQLVSKLQALRSPLEAEQQLQQLQQLISLFESASAALQQLSSSGLVSALEIADCVHILEAYLALNQTIANVEVEEGTRQTCGELDASLTRAFCTRVLPVMRVFFLPGGGQPFDGTPTTTAAATETRVRTAASGSALASPLAAAASLRATADLVRLLQLWLSLAARPSSPPSSSTLPLLASALSLLPSAVSAASARELANAATVVTHIRHAHPSLVAEQHTTTHMIEAMRPKLFQLVGTHQGQLGALECSVLLSNFSKWSETNATSSPAVPEDVVDMLFSRMRAQMRFAHAPQLVPLFEAYVRFGRAYAGCGDRGLAVFFRNVPAAEAALYDAHQRITALINEEDSKVSVVDAAHVLTSVCNLNLNDGLLAEFFLCVEPLLTRWVGSAPSPPRADEVGDAVRPQPSSSPHARTVALHALDMFVATMTSTHTTASTTTLTASGTPDIRVRATTLRDTLLNEAMSHATSASSAKELVMLFRSLDTALEARDTLDRPAGSARDYPGRHDDDPLVAAWTDESTQLDVDTAADDDHAGTDAQKVAAQPDAHGSPVCWDPFVETVTRLAPSCNAFEVAALTSAVAAINKNPQRVAAVHSRAALGALLAQASQPRLTWTLADAKRFLDAARSANAISQLSPTFLDTVACTMQEMTASVTMPNKPLGQPASGDVGFAVQMGRTLLSVLRRAVTATGVPSASPSSALLRSLLNVCATYAHWCEALVDASLDSQQPRSAPEALLSQLCLMSFVLAQMKQASVRLLGASSPASNAVLQDFATTAGGEEAVATAEEDRTADVDDEEANTSPSLATPNAVTDALRNAAAEVAQGVDDALLSVGGVAQLILLRLADLETLAGEDECDVDSVAENDPVPKERVAVPLRPKELIMLLQAYVTADVRHPTLFDDLLPWLVVASVAMDALELSLLLTSLAHLGVWNGRVMMQLAERAASQLTHPLMSTVQAATDGEGRRTSIIRQANGILRALQQTRALTPTTYLAPSRRNTPVRADWHTPKTHSSPTATTTASGSPDSAFTALAQAAVDSLDALVFTKEAMNDTLSTTSLEDLVFVVQVLTSIVTFPPQPTTDAYVVLAVKKLLHEKDVSHRWLRAVSDLAARVDVLRRYDQRVATVGAMRVALDKAQSAVGPAQFAMSLRAAPTPTLVQLFSANEAAQLFYGEALLEMGTHSVREIHDQGNVVDVLNSLASRWATTLTNSATRATAAQGPLIPRAVFRGVEQCLQYLAVPHFHYVSQLLAPLMTGVAPPALSVPALTALRHDRESRHGIFVLLRAHCIAALASSAPLPREGVATTNESVAAAVHRLGEWLQMLFPVVPTPSDRLMPLSGLAAPQLTTLWLSVALAETPRLRNLLPLLQESLYAKESQLQLPHAVDLLLGAARLFDSDATDGDKCGVFDALTSPQQLAVLSIAQLGATTLVRTLHVPEPTGLPKLYESYRLLLAGDACFLRWFSTLKTNTSDSEALQHMQRTVAQVLRWCASCLHVADRGGVRQLKLSPSALKAVNEAIHRTLSEVK